MRAWIIVATTLLVLGPSAIELLDTAFDPEIDVCAGSGGDDDDRCPPFSNDCHDCAQCIHLDGLPPLASAFVPVCWPVSDRALPSIGGGRPPSDAPRDEILTVPRA